MRYETAIKIGKFVMVTHGASDNRDRAKAMLNRGKRDSLESHP